MSAHTQNAEHQTITAFITAHGLTMTVERTADNPHIDNGPGGDRMTHWKCHITRRDNGKRRSLTTIFSMGSGHHGAEPDLPSVLDCLASDAAGYANAQSFEDWAGDYGYDPDSRKAERTYKAVQRAAGKLETFLGPDLYETLLFHTERE